MSKPPPTKSHARYNSVTTGPAPIRPSSPTNAVAPPTSGIRAATIDINAVNLNINELYKQYAKKPGTTMNFNNTTHFYNSSKPAPVAGNYRAISVLETQTTQLTASNFLNSTQVLTNRHASIGGPVQNNRKSSPGKSHNSNYYETCSTAAAAERNDDKHAGLLEQWRRREDRLQQERRPLARVPLTASEMKENITI